MGDLCLCRKGLKTPRLQFESEKVALCVRLIRRITTQTSVACMVNPYTRPASGGQMVNL